MVIRNAVVERLNLSGLLSGYVPYTGATADVDLGAFGLTAASVFTAVGSAAAPSYSFTGFPNQGMYSVSTNVLGFSQGGVVRFQVFAAGVERSAQVRGAGGSAATPTFVGANDTDTGTFFLGSNVFGVATGGTERMRLDASGFAYIGTTTQTGGLSINSASMTGSTDSTPTICAGRTVTGGSALGASFRNFTGTTGNAYIEIAGITSGSPRSVQLRTDSNGNFDIFTGSTAYSTLGSVKFSIIANGAVGINTSPSARLHVVATTEQFRVGYDASNYYSTTVGSTGGVTFNAVGSGAAFTFSDSTTFNTAASTTNATFNKTHNSTSFLSNLAITTVSPTSGANLNQYGVNSTFTVATSAGNISNSNLYAMNNAIVKTGAFLASTLVANRSSISNATIGGSITNAILFQGAFTSENSTNSMTNAYGLKMENYAGSASSTVTNMYAVYLGTVKGTGVTNAYGIYQAGANDLNYFAGNVSIGTTTATARIYAAGQNAATNYAFLLGGDSTAGYNSFYFRSQDHSGDNFGVIFESLNAEEGWTVYHEDSTSGDYVSVGLTRNNFNVTTHTGTQFRVNAESTIEIGDVDGAVNGTRLVIDDASQLFDFQVGAVNVNNLLQCDSFRIDVAPTAEVVVCTHTITISVDGTDYKIPIVAA